MEHYLKEFEERQPKIRTTTERIIVIGLFGLLWLELYWGIGKILESLFTL